MWPARATSQPPKPPPGAARRRRVRRRARPRGRRRRRRRSRHAATAAERAAARRLQTTVALGGAGASWPWLCVAPFALSRGGIAFRSVGKTRRRVDPNPGTSTGLLDDFLKQHALDGPVSEERLIDF